MNCHSTYLPSYNASRLLVLLAALFLWPNNSLRAQQIYIEDIPILIEFMGPLESSGDQLKGKRPSWRLLPEQSGLTRLGLIREGDRVTIGVNLPLGKARIGTWSDRWKSDGGKDCSGWGPWKKCKKKEVFQDCPMPYDQTPLEGPAALKVELLAEGTGTLQEAVLFQDGVSSAVFIAKGPRTLKFSGKFDREPLGCPNPGQINVAPIKKVNIMGEGERTVWFTVKVTVEQPTLDD